MINRILKFIDNYHISGETVIIAFSGGYDSMCLLDIMNKISKEKNIKLVAAHYNHNWRGEEAKREQNYCEEFCNKNKIEFYTETAPIDTPKTETYARELRYDFLKRVAKIYKTDVVFTAHNYDDNAETILYRIIKGTGIVGLQGISKTRDIYYRPLLTCKRSEIVQYCKDNKLTPNDDSSNKNTKYKRNLIRLEILPLLEKINPEVKKALNTLSEVAQSETNVNSEYLSKLSEKLFDNNKIIKSEYIKLPEELKKKIIYNLLYNSDFEYDYQKVQNIYEFIDEQINHNKPSKTSLSDKYWLYTGNKYIEIITKKEFLYDELVINNDGIYKLGKMSFSINKAEKREQTFDEYTAFVDLSKYNNITFRTRRDGDYIIPLGMKGKMKLKKYLINKKIPEYKRDSLGLLANDNEILWVGGVGVSNNIKTEINPTHKISIKYGE